MKIPGLTLANGDKIPALGLGTWQSASGVVGEAVLSAIHAGYRHFDCAPVYGNEKEIGAAFYKAFSDGLVKREDLWITSKLWNDSHERQHVVPALRQTLADLQLDYLDLYLIHWPVALRHGVSFPEKKDDYLSPSEAPLTETWQGMEECIRENLTHHIGVSNFSPARLESVIAFAGHKPEVNQVECHPFLNQHELLATCAKHNVILTAYSPLGSAKKKQGNTPNLFTNKIFGRIAAARGISSAQLALAWAVSRGTVAIPKSTHANRQKENLAAAAIILTSEEIREIDSLNQDFRYIDGAFWTDNGSPYSLDWLWNRDEIS